MVVGKAVRLYSICAGYLVVLGLAAVRNAQGLDPPSLWLDDAWVGLVVRYVSTSEMFTYVAPVPMGFCALEKAFGMLSDDLELSLQLFPFVCGLLQILAVGLLVWRLTQWSSLGLLAAAALAVNRDLITYSVRVKPYTLDGLVVLLLLLVGLPRMNDVTPARLARLVCASLLALPFSFASVFASVPLIHLPLIPSLWRWVRRLGPFPAVLVAIAAAFDLGAGAFYLLRLRGQIHESILAGRLSEGFMPLNSLGSAVRFLVRQVPPALGNAFPRGLEWDAHTVVVAGVCYVSLVAAGIIYLFAVRSWRLAGMFYLAFYLGPLVASALAFYPFGVGRTWAFAHPVTISLAGVGLHALSKAVATRWPITNVPIAAGLFIAGLALVSGLDRQAEYPPYRDAQLVSRLEAIAGRDDLVVVNSDGTPTFGFYTTWPIEPEFRHLRKAMTFTVPGRNVVLLERREISSPPFPEELLKGRSRVVYLEIHVIPKRMRWHVAEEFLTARGFRRTAIYNAFKSRLIVYEIDRTAAGAAA